jgi:hypothetical protein
MRKQPKSNLHVVSSCQQQRLLSPSRSATFVKEIAKEALNCDTLAYMYYTENGGGDPCACIFKFTRFRSETWCMLRAMYLLAVQLKFKWVNLSIVKENIYQKEFENYCKF